MRITVLAVCRRLPDWTDAGCQVYQRRLPREFALQVKHVSPARRGKQNKQRQALIEEATKLENLIPKDCYCIALDERGRRMRTNILAKRLGNWMQNADHVCFLIGGADGLAASLRRRADTCWSLSDFTLPHSIAQLLLLEQLYRAWTMLSKHPYHRE